MEAERSKIEVPNPIHEGMPLAEARRRLQWRARRGLLENDLILQRFFDHHLQALTMPEIQGLMDLLELPDNSLLDLFLGRETLATEAGSDLQRALIEKIRQVR